MAELDINRLSGDMDAQLQDAINSDAANHEQIEKEVSEPVDLTVERDDDTTQAEPNTKEFLAILYSQSPNDSVRSRDGRTYQAAHDANETGRTKYFYCLELVVPLLYWYNPFHGILTDQKHILCPCYLDNGMILVALWRTRCNSPVMHAILFDEKNESCSMCKDAYSRFSVDADKVVNTNLFEVIFRYSL